VNEFSLNFKGNTYNRYPNSADSSLNQSQYSNYGNNYNQKRMSPLMMNSMRRSYTNNGSQYNQRPQQNGYRQQQMRSPVMMQDQHNRQSSSRRMNSATRQRKLSASKKISLAPIRMRQSKLNNSMTRRPTYANKRAG
jgi:hypothetical protein